ncbi:hypothetical protein ACFO8L_08915 [Sphaerisporangium corydalis]|uniref:Uncharacterized protein n=1 Tax=Sphaerisporangium corydalis TaxID=1441875 RepID=A0ABV9EC59_9ACTN
MSQRTGNEVTDKAAAKVADDDMDVDVETDVTSELTRPVSLPTPPAPRPRAEDPLPDPTEDPPAQDKATTDQDQDLTDQDEDLTEEDQGLTDQDGNLAEADEGRTDEDGDLIEADADAPAERHAADSEDDLPDPAEDLSEAAVEPSEAGEDLSERDEDVAGEDEDPSTDDPSTEDEDLSGEDEEERDDAVEVIVTAGEDAGARKRAPKPAEPEEDDVTQVFQLPLLAEPKPVAPAVQPAREPDRPLERDRRPAKPVPPKPAKAPEPEAFETTPAVALPLPSTAQPPVDEAGLFRVGSAPPAEAAQVTPVVPFATAPVAEAGTDRDRRESPSLVTRLASSSSFWLPPLLTVEGLVMYVLALRVPEGVMRGVDLDKIDGLGLVSVLPVTAFAAIALIIVSFFVTLTQNTDRKGLLLLQLAAVTFTLHGAAALIESEPRFHTAWVHAGFSEYIGRAGEALPGLDARFAWPGFFALFGFVLRAAGIEDPATVLQWTPLVSNLLYLLPFVLILRQLVATTRARWFAALLFILVQWIGQDYFSPQGFTFALYLVFIAILMRWFGRAEPRTAPLPPKGILRRLLARLDRLSPGELPARPTTVTDRVVLLTLLVGLFVATTATHQITPFMMLGALTGLILLRRSTLSLALPVFLGLIVIAWINYQATPFWSGRINELFGGIGKIFANLQENTGDRLVGTDPQHAIVLKVRLAICGVILLFAAIGLLRRLRRGVGDRTAAVLLCVPVLALGLQSYGGEIGLRVYMFALPAACILGAYAFFPNLPAHTSDEREGETVPVRRRPRPLRFDPATTRRVSAVLAAVTALVLSVAFLVARYGNEKFERVTTGEAAAMHYIYAHDRPSARVFYLVPVVGEEVTPTIPWRERDIDRVEYDQALVTKDPADVSGVLTSLRSKPANTFVIASRGQAAYLELNHGFPTGWGERFRASLESSPNLKRVFSNADAAIFTLRSYPKGSEIPPPTPVTMVGDRSTPWTPLGLVALALAVFTLFAAELSRLRGTERAARGRRKLVVLGVLMTLAAMAVIVERFVTLTSG